MNLEADNLNTEVKDGRIGIEPGYVEYLRSHGYRIEDVRNVSVVKREDGKPHLTLEIQTYEYPKGHEKLDVVEDKIWLWLCDCWNFRFNSADVSQPGVKPSECSKCVHIENSTKAERAKTDGSQVTL